MSIEKIIEDTIIKVLNPKIKQLEETVQHLEKQLNNATGYVLMSETEAEEYTGYGQTQLWKFRKQGILNNYGERKFIKYLKRELDALLQVKKRA